MEQFAQYGHAIVAVAVYGLIAQILSVSTGVRKWQANMQPGAFYEADYDNPAYRLDRTYLNTSENLVFFAAIVFAAILAGASPFWINLLASLGLMLRIAANLVYLRGIGAGYGGLRSYITGVHDLCNVAMAVLAVLSVF